MLWGPDEEQIASSLAEWRAHGGLETMYTRNDHHGPANSSLRPPATYPAAPWEFHANELEDSGLAALYSQRTAGSSLPFSALGTLRTAGSSLPLATSAPLARGVVRGRLKSVREEDDGLIPPSDKAPPVVPWGSTILQEQPRAKARPVRGSLYVSAAEEVPGTACDKGACGGCMGKRGRGETAGKVLPANACTSMVTEATSPNASMRLASKMSQLSPHAARGVTLSTRRSEKVSQGPCLACFNVALAMACLSRPPQPPLRLSAPNLPATSLSAVRERVLAAATALMYPIYTDFSYHACPRHCRALLLSRLLLLSRAQLLSATSCTRRLCVALLASVRAAVLLVELSAGINVLLREPSISPDPSLGTKARPEHDPGLQRLLPAGRGLRSRFPPRLPCLINETNWLRCWRRVTTSPRGRSRE